VRGSFGAGVGAFDVPHTALGGAAAGEWRRGAHSRGSLSGVRQGRCVPAGARSRLVENQTGRVHSAPRRRDEADVGERPLCADGVDRRCSRQELDCVAHFGFRLSFLFAVSLV
jgi:hypothetical protein